MPAPIAATLEPTAVPPPPPPPVDPACRAQLASLRAQLAECNAACNETKAGDASAKPEDPGWDEETTRLVRMNETNTERVGVSTECGIRIYLPGQWPPPEGPPKGARIAWVKVDGGIIFHEHDGGVTFVKSSKPPRLCPCPEGSDGGEYNPFAGD
jgi:hypothetical protein